MIKNLKLCLYGLFIQALRIQPVNEVWRKTKVGIQHGDQIKTIEERMLKRNLLKSVSMMKETDGLKPILAADSTLRTGWKNAKS